MSEPSHTADPFALQARGEPVYDAAMRLNPLTRFAGPERRRRRDALHGRRSAGFWVAFGRRPSIERAAEQLGRSLAEPLTIGEIAREAGLSPRYFIHVFRREMGRTPYDYRIEKRLDHAVERLREGASPADAAVESGFSDQSHLTRAMKARRGMTPGALQRRTIVQDGGREGGKDPTSDKRSGGPHVVRPPSRPNRRRAKRSR